jgi:hypothetical protein|tara:strand:- start:485 stop:1234 length:750 start_codon:yes stop_codon:yes gene_type:complete
MQISIGNIIKGNAGTFVPAPDKNTPILPGMVVYYNIDDLSSYNFSSTKTTVNNLASSGGYGGNITRDAGLYPEKVTLNPSTYCGYGTDSNGKFVYFQRGTTFPILNVNQSLNLTNWTAQFKVKNRGIFSTENYFRFLGTVNYSMELVHNSGNIWYYTTAVGWVNTGISYPDDGNYHTITFTYTDSPKLFNIYMDSVLVYTTNLNGIGIITSKFWVQGSQDNRQDPSYFNKFLLYDRALNQTEINNNNNI